MGVIFLPDRRSRNIKKGLNYFLFFIVLIILGQTQKEEKREALRFEQVVAYELSKQEKLSVCHAIQGSIVNSFSYQESKDGIVELYNGKPESYCAFYHTEIEIGDINTNDVNKCHTLTKAQISRGAVPTSTEYNPQYSVYKNGMIYWKCENGKSPKSIDVRNERFDATPYRYEKDKDILLVKADYRILYFYKGKVFKTVSSEKASTMYNGDTLKVTHSEYFDYTPYLVPFGSKI